MTEVQNDVLFDEIPDLSFIGTLQKDQELAKRVSGGAVNPDTLQHYSDEKAKKITLLGKNARLPASPVTILEERKDSSPLDRLVDSFISQ